MKKIFFLIVFSPFLIFSQVNKEIVLLKERDSTIVKKAHVYIDDIPYTFSNGKGIFQLRVSNKKGNVRITHIGFLDKVLLLNEIIRDTLYLKEKNNVLNEVLITKKRRKRIEVFPKKNLLTRIGYFKGHKIRLNKIYATFLSKPKKKIYRITKVLIETSKGYWGDSKKKYMPFKVNLYFVDSISGYPSKKILPHSILVREEDGKKKYVEVDVSKLYIDYPDNGIFVSVEPLTEREYYTFSYISKELPAFKILKKNRKSRTYYQEYKYGKLITNWGEEKYPLNFIYNFGVELELEN